LKNIIPEEPLKGSFNIRIGVERHRHIFEEANALEISLNEYICKVLDEHFKKPQCDTSNNTQVHKKRSLKEETSPAVRHD